MKKSEDGQGKIELLIAMVKYRTVIKKIREGLCSRYMSSLKVGDELTVLLCKGGMKVDMTRPAILVGPGTGIAPLRSMLLAKAKYHEDDPEVEKYKQLLFFGNRNKEADYFFEQDWQSLQNKIDLEVFNAFSRDQVCISIGTSIFHMLMSYQVTKSLRSRHHQAAISSSLQSP